jgi:hypothetical protein
MGNIEYSEALEFIVCGADIAGGLEEKEKIFPDSDTTLTWFLCKAYNEWKNNRPVMDWIPYIEEELLREFGA